MPTATVAHAPQRAQRPRKGLRSRVGLPDGRVFAGELAPARHRSLQIGLSTQETEGLVELAAGVRRDGRLQITTRRRADHFLPGGRSALLKPHGDKHAVIASHWLWVDVDQPGQLHALWVFLAERPCHLLVESGGSRGVWRGSEQELALSDASQRLTFAWAWARRSVPALPLVVHLDHLAGTKQGWHRPSTARCGTAPLQWARRHIEIGPRGVLAL